MVDISLTNSITIINRERKFEDFNAIEIIFESFNIVYGFYARKC